MTQTKVTRSWESSIITEHTNGILIDLSKINKYSTAGDELLCKASCEMGDISSNINVVFDVIDELNIWLDSLAYHAGHIHKLIKIYDLLDHIHTFLLVLACNSKQAESILHKAKQRTKFTIKKFEDHFYFNVLNIMDIDMCRTNLTHDVALFSVAYQAASPNAVDFFMFC